MMLISCVPLSDLGHQERESLQKIAEVAKEGFLLKQQLIQQAQKGLEEKQVPPVLISSVQHMNG